MDETYLILGKLISNSQQYNPAALSSFIKERDRYYRTQSCAAAAEWCAAVLLWCCGAVLLLLCCYWLPGAASPAARPPGPPGARGAAGCRAASPAGWSWSWSCSGSRVQGPALGPGSRVLVLVLDAPGLEVYVSRWVYQYLLFNFLPTFYYNF